MRSTSFLAALLLSLSVSASPLLPRAECTRDTLTALTTAYVAAQKAGSPSALTSAGFTLASSGAYFENFAAANPSSGILSQALKIDLTRSYHDTTACSTYTEIIVTDSKHPYVIGSQIHLDGTKITKLDTIVTDQGDWLFNAAGTLKWASTESWAVIPEAERDSRAVIKAAADAYLDIFKDKSVKVPWGTPCARLEGGSYTGSGKPTDRCDVGIPNNVELVERRYVIDETVGAVDVFLNFGGRNGLPDSHEFRIEKGKIRYVHTLTVMR